MFETATNFIHYSLGKFRNTFDIKIFGIPSPRPPQSSDVMRSVL